MATDTYTHMAMYTHIHLFNFNTVDFDGPPPSTGRELTQGSGK